MTDRPFCSPGAVHSHALENSTWFIHAGEVTIGVRVLNPRVVRIRYAPGGAFAARRSWSPAPADEDFPPLPVSVRETGDELELDTGIFRVVVQRSSALLTCRDAAGRDFFRDDRPPQIGANELRSTRRMEAGEHFYGFGERTGPLEKTGRAMTNWTTDPALGHGPGTDPMYIAIPVYMAARPGLAYSVYFNNTWRSGFDLSQPGQITTWAQGGELDFYVAYGPTPAEALQAMSGVLGRMPMPPRWALGYHQSRWSYMSADEVRQVAGEMRARGLPLDAVHLDIDYMDGYRDFTVNPRTFPDLPGLVRELGDQNIRVVPIIDAGVKADLDYFVYREGLERGYFVQDAHGQPVHGFVWPDDSVWCDHTRAEVRAWWGDCHRGLAEAGVAGIWNDMNEPAVFELPFSQGGGKVGTLPLDARQGGPDEPAAHAEVHNLTGHLLSRASYEGMRRLMNGRRPFLLTRSAFAGIQRWSACWMGDNDAWWEHLQMSLPQLMNMGLSGVPFVGVDIGGFGHNATPELFARWIELGALYPFCRGHSAMGTIRQEPYAFGPDVEAIARRYLHLRYRLMPYLYTLFWQAHETGAPVFRPLLYEFPDDPALAHLDDQVMLGAGLMAAPVVQPGRTTRAVYFPAGEWVDWWSGERIVGPAHRLVQAPLDVLPLFARAGMVIPCGPETEHTVDGLAARLTLELFAGEGRGEWVEDDGWSTAYEQGAVARRAWRLTAMPGGWRLEVGAAWGGLAIPARPVTARLHQPDGGVIERTCIDSGAPWTLDF